MDTETVTVVRPGGRNAYGDDTGAVTRFDIPGSLFAPGASREAGFSTEQVETDGTVYAPPGEPATLVRSTDRIEVRGDLYTVVGDIQNWGSAGVVIVLRRYTG